MYIYHRPIRFYARAIVLTSVFTLCAAIRSPCDTMKYMMRSEGTASVRRPEVSTVALERQGEAGHVGYKIMFKPSGNMANSMARQ